MTISISNLVQLNDSVIACKNIALQKVRNVIYIKPTGDYPYKMLLVGETSSIKTSFLNLSITTV